MKLLRRGEHTEGASETCEYTPHGLSCGKLSAGELRVHMMEHQRPWGLCDEHVKPEHHPPDLHEHLYRW